MKTSRINIHKLDRIKILARLTLLTGLLACPAWAAGALHVSPAGNDANPGTAQQPLASFAAAQKAARQHKVPVVFHAGTYYLPETLVFTAEDSGTSYAAAPGEKAIISGGMKLIPKWQPHRDGIMKAEVPAGLNIEQLFINGNKQWMARYPNYDANVHPYFGFAADAFSPQRAARWADPTNGYMHAMHVAHWGGYSYRITGKKPNGELTYEGGWQNNRQMGMHKQFRYVENIFEELDAPGEWFHDTKTSTLYYQPAAGVDLTKSSVEVVRLRTLIEFTGTRDKPVKGVTLSGFIYQHAARTFMETKEPLLRSDWTIYRGGALLFTGTEDCVVADSEFDQLGGNAVFVSGYNRRVAIRGCHIHDCGATGVAFVGDPRAVRNPLFEYRQQQKYATVDKAPGPKTDDYPADCLVEDSLIHAVGMVEKQATGVQIAMAMNITVRHCSIYDTSRAGINIGDGCWGGHVIEFCDVFDTVKETGDHGSFNSWGRDRYWNLRGAPPPEWPALAKLDATRPVILRNSRWRCDHGWDIDLDDGSSHYEIYNNLCLNGGLKNREGFFRTVENNIIVKNSFHPHVWYENSEDIFRRNIVFTAYKPIGVDKPWGKEINNNLLHKPGLTSPVPAAGLRDQSGRDEHSLEGDAMFVNPATGDYRVKDGSPALALGFKNFPMDQFGVQKPALRALAKSPVLPEAGPAAPVVPPSNRSDAVANWLGASVKNLVGLGEVSATGMSAEIGVRVAEIPNGCAAAKAGFQSNDVILRCNNQPTDTLDALLKACREATGKGKIKFEVWRKQQSQTVEWEF
ncbi:MAG: PDZ domain-containing protein [Verrucomicrobiota bacterium]